MDEYFEKVKDNKNLKEYWNFDGVDGVNEFTNEEEVNKELNSDSDIIFYKEYPFKFTDNDNEYFNVIRFILKSPTATKYSENEGEINYYFYTNTKSNEISCIYEVRYLESDIKDDQIVLTTERLVSSSIYNKILTYQEFEKNNLFNCKSLMDKKSYRNLILKSIL